MSARRIGMIFPLIGKADDLKQSILLNDVANTCIKILKTTVMALDHYKKTQCFDFKPFPFLLSN